MANTNTLVELGKRTNNNELVNIINTLSQESPMMDDAPWLESTDMTSHVFTKTLSLPSGTFRRFNEGIEPTGARTKQESVGLSMLDAESVVDKALAEIMPNPKQYRSREDQLFIEGLSQQLENQLMYGSLGDNPAGFDGLATYFDSIGSNVIDAGGSGADLMSIWIVQWGEGKVNIRYPRNDKQYGIHFKDLGEEPARDADGREFRAYKTWFNFKAALCVEDDRCVQRIANIETQGDTNIFNHEALSTALARLPNMGKGNTIIYVTRTGLTQIDNDAVAKENVNYGPDQAYGGQWISRYKTLPLRVCDAMTDTESELT